MNLYYTPSHHPVTHCNLGGDIPMKLCTWPSVFCSFFGVNFCWFEFLLKSASAQRVLLLKLFIHCDSLMIASDLLFSQFLWKKSASVFSSIEIEEFLDKNRKQNKKPLMCWMSEDITCLNVVCPLCGSLLTPSQHGCLNADTYTEVCMFPCTCGPINQPTNTHACMHFLQEMLKLLLFSLMFTFHFSSSREEIFIHQSISLKLALRL